MSLSLFHLKNFDLNKKRWNKHNSRHCSRSVLLVLLQNSIWVHTISQFYWFKFEGKKNSNFYTILTGIPSSTEQLIQVLIPLSRKTLMQTHARKSKRKLNNTIGMANKIIEKITDFHCKELILSAWTIGISHSKSNQNAHSIFSKWKYVTDWSRQYNNNNEKAITLNQHDPDVATNNTVEQTTFSFTYKWWIFDN